ncbi:MAG: hypothetical protein V4619_05700 [Bacteroidota bacterium]
MKRLFVNAIATLLLLTSCNLFEKDERLVKTVKSPDGKVVKLYYVGLGATTNDVIQIRQIDKNNNELLIKAYEHNIVDAAKFITKDSVLLILSDTGLYGASKKRDTVKLLIK